MKNTLERLIIKGVLKKLGQHFQLTIDSDLESEYRQLVSGLITSNDRYEVIQKIRKQQNTDKPFTLPFIGLVIENISLDYNSGRSITPHYNTGNYVLTDETNFLNKIVRTIPVLFEGTVLFLTDDFWQAMAFASKWIIGSVDRSTLNFEALFHNIQFSITIELNTSLAFPQKDNTLDMVNLYEISAAITIKSYVTDPVEFEKLLTATSVRQINVGLKQLNGVEGLEEIDLSDITVS